MEKLSAIEQIATDIKAWGDGWFFAWNPDDHGRRARLVRNHEESIRIEFEIHDQQNEFFVFAGCSVRLPDGHWTTVSVSLRNPTNRKALDYIHRCLDILAPTSESTEQGQ